MALRLQPTTHFGIRRCRFALMNAIRTRPRTITTRMARKTRETTRATTILALLPIMFGHGTGSEVMQRIAVPMVGELVSSTVLTLIIVPVLIYLVRARKL